MLSEKNDNKIIAESVPKILALLNMARKNPSNPDYYMHAAKLCWKIGETQRALNLLTKAFNLSPENQYITMALSHALVGLGQTASAKEIFHRHIEIIEQQKQNDIFPFITNAEDTDDLAHLPMIDIDGYLVDPDESWFDLVFDALIGKSQHPHIEPYYRKAWEEKKVTKEELVLCLVNAPEFKKQGISWFACGQARRYLSEIKRFWHAYETKHPIKDKIDSYILVSFLHPDPTNKVRNGLIGKYLQHREHLKLIAIGRDDKYATLNRHLADAYGMEKCLPLRLNNNPVEVSLREHLRTGNHLRKDLLNLMIGGIKVGDLIYDEYLRSEMACTITHIDDRLETIYQEAKAYKSYYDHVFNAYDIKRVVLDHSVYLQWGILARIALQKKIPVLTHHGRSSPIIGRLHPPEADTIEYEVKISPSVFDHIYEDCGETMAQKGLDILKHYYIDRKAHKHSLVAGDDFRLYSRRELIERLRLENSKPIVFIMAHTMSDAPHFLGSLLFDDYFQWLKATLDIVGTIPQVNWIIKEHPFAKTYTGENSALKMVSSYASGYSHICACPLDFHPGGLIDCADAIVTARGTVGLEAAAFGKPVVLAGESPYSGLGFTIEPVTIDAYRESLCQLETPAPLKTTAIERARCFAYLYLEASRVDCAYLPHQPLVALDPIPDDMQWKAMADLLSNPDITQDPLYRNLMVLLDHEHCHLFNFDKLHAGNKQFIYKTSDLPSVAAV